MKKVIRNCVFETNSSATHSIIILSVDDAKRWEEEGDLYVVKDLWSYPWKDSPEKPEKGRLYTRDEVIKLLKNSNRKFDESDEDEVEEVIRDEGFITAPQWEELELEFDDNEFVTPSGDRMVAMCCYGSEY